MLNRLSLSHWKSFDTANLDFGKSTLLVGPNGAGKSNVFDALRFLQGAALDLPLTDVLGGRWEGGRQVWPGIRGGEAESALGGGWFAVGTVWPGQWHLLSVLQKGSASVHIETLSDSLERRTDLFDTHASSLGTKKGPQPGGAINVAYRSVGGGRSGNVTLSAARSLLGQIEPTERMDPAVVEAARAVRRALREIIHLEILPSAMRGPAPLHAAQMGASGENVAAVLYEMSEKDRQEVLDWLTELCAPNVTKLEFEVVQSVREVYLFLVEANGTRISARSLSDGTLRFLGILVGLLTAPEGSLILLEEPDVGLHPARIHLLAEILEAIPKRRNIQVIATTHSPVLLAHLSDEMLADVLAFDRDKETGHSVVKRVGELPYFERLRTSQDRGHLIATGWLERAL